HCLSTLTHRPSSEISPLSLHDALPISAGQAPFVQAVADAQFGRGRHPRQQRLDRIAGLAQLPRLRLQQAESLLDHRLVVGQRLQDRKSTRLNSSHVKISYAVFCLKKKK